MSPVAVAAVLAPLVAGAGLAPSGPRSEVVVTFTDPAIVEASGLVVRDGEFMTVNDSGDTGRVFTVDERGRTIGVTGWGEATDVEAVAPLPGGRVLVGDIGDNLARRATVSLVEVPVGRGEREVSATTYPLRYPDGPQDAESLAVHPRTGRVVIVTKGPFGGKVMLAPRRLDPDGVNRLREVGVALPVATDAAFFPDGRHLVVRSYTRAVVYTWPGLESVGRFALPDQPQGEGIAVDEEGAVCLSSEGERSEVLRVRLPPRIERAMTPPALLTPSEEASAGEEPAVEDDGPWWPWLVGGLLALLGLAGLGGLEIGRRRRAHG